MVMITLFTEICRIFGSEELAKVAPVIWDERIKDCLDQVNIYTSNEIYESVNG